MNRFVDLAIEYEGGTWSTRIVCDEKNIPRVDQFLTIEIEGKQRRVRINHVFPPVVHEGSPVIPVHATVASEPK